MTDDLRLIKQCKATSWGPKSELVCRQKIDLFAWFPVDIPSINLGFLCHHLSILLQTRLLAQEEIMLRVEHQSIINKEVTTLIIANFIQEITYTTWHMYANYTDLNKTCLKGTYLLPNIDQLVDNTTGYEMLSLLDA